VKRLLLVLFGLAFVLPPVALAASNTGESEDKGAFISEEWDLHAWIPIHIGPIDMSINKAVAYLLLGALCFSRAPRASISRQSL